MQEQTYPEIFQQLGRPLKPTDTIGEEKLAQAERRLQCSIPAELKAFYLAAGKATDILDFHDHFLPPEQWSFHEGKLIFMEENQVVVLYAVDVTTGQDNPPVLMASNQETLEWYEVCSNCSEFLRVMIHWQCAFGGAMPGSGVALVDEDFTSSLFARFNYIGRVNDLQAYNAPGIAVCVVQWDDGLRAYIGVNADEDLDAFEQEFGVEIEQL